MNLFYSEKEKILFWIAGYTPDDNTSYVVEKAGYLIQFANEFADTVKVDANDVRTFFVEKSRRYKYNRVFYVENFKGLLPEGTYTIGENNDWTMWNWITD